MTDVEPYPLTLDDLDWVTGLAAARRARLAPLAPRFWNPSPDARAVHAEFLGRLIGSPDVKSGRPPHRGTTSPRLHATGVSAETRRMIDRR